ncbi:MAG: beta-lactamase family protein [Gemmatimonadales bacterium]|nr:beta-lactamase family protein [Gemmatimonadales bacterium]
MPSDIRLLAAGFMLCLASSSAAQGPSEIAAAVDRVAARAVDSARTPGMAAVVVRHGQVILLKGYGVSSVERKEPVDPALTIFRLASVAKLFVATAAMQQADAGTLDFGADVNRYLGGFSIPEAFGRPITLHDLLTHTAGFDEWVIRYAVPPDSAPPSLETALRAALPSRVRAPGQVTAYSNYGFGLAAYAVERVTERPFDLYASERIFRPLGMERTSYRAPRSDSQGAVVAEGHRCRAGACVAASPIVSRVYPPGLAFSTALDMSRFLLLQLGQGGEEMRPVLSDSARARMQREQFTNDSWVSGIGYAFFREQRRGREVLTHSGGVPGFASLLLLVPAEGLGVFLVNNGGALGVNTEVVDSLFALFAVNAEPTTPPFGAPVSGDFAGQYLSTRAPMRGVSRFPGLFLTDRLSVEVVGEALTVSYPNGNAVSYRQVGALTFETAGGDRRIAFGRDAAGRVRWLYAGVPVGGASFPGAFARLPWYGTPPFVNEYISWLVLFPLLLLPVWGLARLIRRWRRRRAAGTVTPGSIPVRLAVALTLVTSAAFLLFGFGFVARSNRELGSGGPLLYGPSEGFLRLSHLPPILALFGAGMVVLAVMLWWRRSGTTIDRLGQSAVAIWAALMAHFLVVWDYLPLRW